MVIFLPSVWCLERSNMAAPTIAEINLTLVYHGNPQNLTLPVDSTISDLSSTVKETLGIPFSNQKFLVQKLGLLRPPFKDPNLPASVLLDKKVILLAPNPTDISTLAASIASGSRPRRSPISNAKPARTHDWKRVKENAEFTFHTLRPLPYFPHPERSLKFLERLRDDPGIRSAMRKHQFSVSLLTEMDPAAHTSATHEGVSRTLGLNRNRGEVIELRLRTDAGDGYRDYKTIRKTLCHELAHNTHGPHDAEFWKLCKDIEKEVEMSDWTTGGQVLSKDQFYTPPDDELVDENHIDGGGWIGGEYVLGRNEETGQVVEDEVSGRPLNRREVLARAAEQRMKRATKQQPQSENQETDAKTDRPQR